MLSKCCLLAVSAACVLKSISILITSSSSDRDRSSPFKYVFSCFKDSSSCQRSRFITA
uniref:Filament-like plant protein isoform X1 n=1 Tax=Rhizophora mucronata TaxID=61149 RepID=A0A2P2QUZ9_RHIMU